MRQSFLFVFFIICLIISGSCRTRNNEYVTVALSEKFSTLDTLTTTASDAGCGKNSLFNVQFIG